MADFSGFRAETFGLLAGLAAHNSRDWFEAHRRAYEHDVRDAALDFITAMAPQMQALTPRLVAEPRINGSLKRINRDVRFSKDKTPYNPHLHMVFWTGDQPNTSPAMHLVIRPDGIGYGAGVFGLTPDQLTAYRSRICDPVHRAALLAATDAAQAIGCAWDAPELKRLPAGLAADGDWEHLLRRKSFVMRTLDDRPLPDWIGTADCVAGAMALTRACLPLIAWLSDRS